MKIFDRKSGSFFEEKIFGGKAVDFLWGNSWISRFFAPLFRWLVANFAFPSTLFGWWAKSSLSKGKIRPFIESFEVDSSEFEDRVENFQNFNAFFTRRLKKGARPIDSDPRSIIIPADGRYLCYEKTSSLPFLSFKGRKWSLEWLLGDLELANQYREGAIILGRLAPPDYHWFHFPFDTTPEVPYLKGKLLHSVHPMALKKRPTIFCENKRKITHLNGSFGVCLMLEVGATNVGSIEETFTPFEFYKKGDPKGFFSFGGSQIILLFQKGAIQLDEDLILKSRKGIETRCLIGQGAGLWV